MADAVEILATILLPTGGAARVLGHDVVNALSAPNDEMIFIESVTDPRDIPAPWPPAATTAPRSTTARADRDTVRARNRWRSGLADAEDSAVREEAEDVDDQLRGTG